MVLNGLLLMKDNILAMSILHLILNAVILILPIIHLPLLIILLSPNICMILLLKIIVYVMKWIISPITSHCLSLNIDVCKTIHNPTVHRSRKQWYRASESDKSIYRKVLDNCLKCIHVHIESINCNNMVCNESVH